MMQAIAAAILSAIGAVLFLHGLWLVWPPAVWMLAGLLLGAPAFLVLYGHLRTLGNRPRATH